MKWGHHKSQEDLENDNTNGGNSIKREVKNKIAETRKLEEKNRAIAFREKIKSETDLHERAWQKYKAEFVTNKIKSSMGKTPISKINKTIEDKINKMPSIQKIKKQVLSKIDAGKKQEEVNKAIEATNKVNSVLKSKFGKK